jgi:hypothetical protein
MRLNAEATIEGVARVVWPRPVRLTWVSATGNLGNHRAASCQTLSGVLSKIVAAGQINVVDRSYPPRARSSVGLRTLIAVCATFLMTVFPGTALRLLGWRGLRC